MVSFPTMPTVGGDAGTWGTELNALLAALEALFNTQDLPVGRHLLAPSSDATSASVYPGAGLNSQGLTGNDTRGILSLNVASTSPAISAAGARVIDVTFAHPFTSTPIVLLTPTDQINGAMFVVGNRSPTGFSLYAQTLLTAGASYAVAYLVLG